MRKLVACLALTSSITLTGCSDPKAANEKNLGAAIQAYLDQTYPQCYVRMKFPLEGFVPDSQRRQLEALKSVGFVSEKELSRKEYKEWGSGETRVNIQSVFDLTDEGRKNYRLDTEGYGAGKFGGFCFGKATVKEIVNFTEPSEALGHKITRVNFTYQVDDIPAWARNDGLTAGNQRLRTDIESGKKPAKEEATLIATNKGWIHERLFRQ